MLARFSFLIILACSFAVPAFAQVSGSVDGTVTYQDGSAAAGANVSLDRNGFGGPIFVTADAEGYYSFDSVLVGNYVVSAQLEDLHAQGEFVAVFPDSTSTVDLVLGGALDEEGSVAGVVYLSEGGVAIGAVVNLDRNNGTHLQTVTDINGTFSFASVEEGNYHISAFLMGEGSASDNIVVEADQTTNVELTLSLAETATINGTVWVYADSVVAAGATVTLDGHGMFGEDYTTTADAEGSYAFEGVLAGMYSISAELGDLESGWEWIEMLPGQTQTIDIVLDALDEEGSVAGLVMLETGEVAVGAIVNLDGGGNNGHWGIHLTTITDITGSFSFNEVDEGTYSISAHLMGEGFASDFIEVEANQTTNVTLTLHQGGGGGGNPFDRLDTLTGIAMVDTIMENGFVHISYRLNTDDDAEAEFILRFGPPDYDPDGFGIGAERPENGAEITVIALIVMHNFGLPDAIVLFIDGMFWATPPNDHGGGGWHDGDTLTVVDLQGVAIVVTDDNRPFPRYFIDINADGNADYRLGFGPPWYNPDNGATRPENGAEITIHGGLFNYGNPQMVVVWEINGQFWREPHNGHGGLAGGDLEEIGCMADQVIRVEMSGTAMVNANGGFHGDVNSYGADVDGDAQVDFRLDFGATTYIPDGDGERLMNNQEFVLVGGIISCDNEGIPIVQVYEVNGGMWREPGDTTGIGASSLDIDPVDVPTPVTYLVANNFPNPFNPSTTIQYSIPVTGDVMLKIFDITGREVETLVNEFQNSGTYNVVWSAEGMPSGIYFYQLRAGSLSFTNRMILMK